MANINAFVGISPRDPRYFESRDGTAYIPIGLNLCFVRFTEDQAEGLQRYSEWMRELSRNGGNFFRIWLGHAFFDVEHECSGQYDLEKLSRFDALLSMARDFGLRVKVCLEYFRTLNELKPPFAGAPSFGKPIHHLSRGGPAADMRDFCADPHSRNQFLRKLDWLAARYADEPAIFGWELWNEMNAVEGDAWQDWTAFMLPELKQRFPNHLVMQSLGGFEHLSDRAVTVRLSRCRLTK